MRVMLWIEDVWVVDPGRQYQIGGVIIERAKIKSDRRSVIARSVWHTGSMGRRSNQGLR
jgi:hypothetical protein